MSDDQIQNEEAPKEEEVKAEEAPKEEAAAEAPKEEQAAAPAEEAPKAEGGDAAPAEGPKKKKKINKLTLEELNKQIEKLEKADQTQSRYYKHLQSRKDELQQTA